MGYDELACASCGGPVSEGRCGTCRAARQMLRSQEPVVTVQLVLQALAAILAVFVALALVVQYAG